MNIASVLVLGVVEVLFVFSIISFRKKDIGECSENCSTCAYSCHKEDSHYET